MWRSSSMSKNQPSKIIEENTPKSKTIATSHVNISTNNTAQEMFSLSMKDSISPGVAGEEVVWQYNIPIISANEKRLIMDMQDGQIVFTEIATDQFPKEIFLYCQQIGGYLDWEGNATSKIAIFRPKSIVPIVKDGVTYHTVIYSVSAPATWDLGLTRVLSFRVGDEQGVFTPPLQSAVMTEFKILHISY